MSSNPYESPQSPQSDKPKPRQWGRRCLWSAVVAIVAFSIIVASTYSGYSPDGPSTPMRQAAAGVHLIILLAFYGGILSSFACGILWLINLGRK